MKTQLSSFVATLLNCDVIEVVTSHRQALNQQLNETDLIFRSKKKKHASCYSTSAAKTHFLCRPGSEGGAAGVEQRPEQAEQLAKTEVSLTLASRVEVKDDDDSDVKNLLLRSVKKDTSALLSGVG